MTIYRSKLRLFFSLPVRTGPAWGDEDRRGRPSLSWYNDADKSGTKCVLEMLSAFDFIHDDLVEEL